MMWLAQLGKFAARPAQQDFAVHALNLANSIPWETLTPVDLLLAHIWTHVSTLTVSHKSNHLLIAYAETPAFKFMQNYCWIKICI